MQRVVIIGGGFGGLYAAKALGSVPVAVTLIDRRNHHVFQPLLYQVATAGLSAIDFGEPARGVLRGAGRPGRSWAAPWPSYPDTRFQTSSGCSMPVTPAFCASKLGTGSFRDA